MGSEDAPIGRGPAPRRQYRLSQVHRPADLESVLRLRFRIKDSQQPIWNRQSAVPLCRGDVLWAWRHLFHDRTDHVFAIGFLVASLIGLVIIPLVHTRAVQRRTSLDFFCPRPHGVAWRRHD